MTPPESTTVNLGFDLSQLQGMIGAVGDAPQAGQTVCKANTRWTKGSGFRSEAQLRDFTIPMTEPPPLGGSNTAPNLVAMVLGAYELCLSTGYGMNAALRGIDLNGFFDLREGTWPGYTDVRAKVRLVAPQASPEDLQALHAHVTRTSPVGCILSRPVNVLTELQT